MLPKSNSQDRSSRLWIYSGSFILCLGFLIFVANLGDSGRDAGSVNEVSDTTGEDRVRFQTPESDRGTDGSVGPSKTRSATRKSGEVADLVPGEFPLVERILVDTNQSELEAAQALAQIARRNDVSVEERFEALAHGLNLDFKSFAGLADDASLPVELAQRYLDELRNQNQHLILQIEGCVALLGHSNKDIQSQASEQLAFLVEAESMAESPDELKVVASAKLQELRKNPPIPVTQTPGDLAPDHSLE